MWSRSIRLISSTLGTEMNQTYWNTIAEWYIKYNRESSNKIYRAMAPFLNLASASAVIDVGCGSGNGIEILKEFASPKAKFTMTEISEVLLAKAKEAEPSVEALQENAESLPFKQDTFDVYVANGLIENVPNSEWVLNEAYRVIKPGGRIGFSIYGRMGLCNTVRAYKNIRNRLRPTKQAQEPKFELSDPERVMAITKQVGFKDTFYFYKQYHFPQINTSEIIGLYEENPILRKIAIDEGKIRELRQIIVDEIEFILYEREEPLVYEGLVIIGTKPSSS